MSLVSFLPVDIPTLAISRALMQMALGGLILYLGSQERRESAARWWAAGLLVNGIALLVFPIQAPAWDRLLTMINHIGGGIASACLLMGFWRFGRQRPQRGVLALLLLIPLASLVMWEIHDPNARLRVLATASGQLLFLFALQWTLVRPPRVEMRTIYRRLRWITLAYALVFVWSYGSIAGLLPTTAQVGPGYHRALFSLGSLLFMLALAVTCLALQFTLLAAHNADLALHDWLTGVLNRRGLFELVSSWPTERASDADRRVAIVLDVDHFKAINDRHGHAAGDRSLRAIGSVLAAHAGAERLIARMGGEEFAIVARGMSLAAATDIAEQVRHGCATLAIPAREGTIRLTISAGVAEGEHDQDLGELLARADAALYAAKEAGRDRVVAAQSASHSRPAPLEPA